MTNRPPILKTQWERYRAHLDLDQNTLKQLIAPYSQQRITNLTALSDGCANSNYNVEFANGEAVILRIYLREKTALAREQGLHALLEDKLPIAKLYYSDASEKIIEHPYAIMQFIEGEMMRDVILTGNEAAIGECAFSAGHYLKQLKNIKLSHGGFFQDNKLTIQPFNDSEDFLTYASSCLANDNVKDCLGKTLTAQAQQFVNNAQAFLPDKEDINLTHADYDSANLLVKKINGHYQVTGILDWEFAFAGSYLLDAGAFLRYSHKLPTCYQNQFIQGMNASNLPTDWLKTAKLMDLISLLSLLFYNLKAERPKLCGDVTALIENTLLCWPST